MSNRVRIKPQDIDRSGWAEAPVDRDKLRSIGWQRSYSAAGGKKGDFTKAVTDENNATVTEHWDDRQDVLLRPPTVTMHAGAHQG